MSANHPSAARRTKRARPDAQAALPAWKAFVVQFTHETGSRKGTFSGRAEHLGTGQRANFKSVGALVDFVNAVLQENPAGRSDT